MDRLFAKFEKGKIFLKFEGFDLKEFSGNNLVPLFYFRSVFAYYPGRILVGEPELIIKKGNEFLENPFEPDDEWLARNDVNYVVTLKYGNPIGFDVRELSKEFQPLGARGLVPVLMRILYFIAAGLLVLLMSIFFSRLMGPEQRRAESFKPDIFSIFSIVTISMMFLAVCGHSILMPLYEWDSFAIWGLKAKVLFYEGLGSDYFQNPNLAYSHLDYPLLVPFLMSAGAFSSPGYMGEMTSKIIFPFLYLAFVILIYNAARWRLDRKHALLLTAVFASTPALVRWSGAGTADMALSFFYAGSIFYLIKFFDDGKFYNLAISIIFALCCALTKNEGLPLVIINFIVLLIFSSKPLFSIKNLKAPVLYISVFIILYLPWFFFSSNIPKIHENYLGQLTIAKIAGNIDRLSLIIPEMILQFSSIKSWGLVWILALLAGITGPVFFRSKAAFILWCLLAGQLLLYILIYVIYPYNDLSKLLSETIERLYLHILPTGLLIIALQIPSPEKAEEASPATTIIPVMATVVTAPAAEKPQAPAIIGLPAVEKAPASRHHIPPNIIKAEKPKKAKPRTVKKDTKKTPRKKKSS